jgi:TetR/AcrR family transcriptional regulator
MEPSKDAKAAIFQSALTEFALHGFSGARTAAIVARAGVNKQLLYYYFGSKSLLYESVVQAALDAFADGQRSRLGTERPPDRLRGRIQAAFAHLAHHPEHAHLILAAMSDGVRESASARPVADELAVSFAKEISVGQGLGHFRDDVDPNFAAHHALVLVLGFFVTHDPASAVLHEGDEWIRSVGNLLVRALSW